MAVVCRRCGHANADGAQFCVRPGCGEFLDWQTQMASGPVVGGPRAQPVYHTQKASAAITLTATDLVVAPGATVTTSANVLNGGSQVEEFTISVVGPAAAWAVVEPPTLHIYPGDRADATIRFAPPRHPSTVPGRAGFTITVMSTLHASLAASANGAIDVGAFRGVRATMVPQQSSGRGRTVHRVDLTNDGNVVEPVRVDATDPTGTIRFAVPPTEIPIAPGGASIDVAVTPPRHFFGRPRQMPFQVTVATGESAMPGGPYGPPPPGRPPYGGGLQATPPAGIPVAPIRLDGIREALPVVAPWVPKVATGLLTLAVVAGAILAFLPGGPFRKTAKVIPPPVVASGTPAPTLVTPTTPGGGNTPKTSAPPKASASPPPAALPNMSVVVDGSGNQVRGEGFTSVTHLGTGRFEANFSGDVSACSYVAAVGFPDATLVTAPGLVFTASGHSSKNGVYVETKNIGGGLADFPYHLQVQCPGTGQWAVSDANGNLIRSNRAKSITHVSTGLYEVKFKTDMTGCSYVATIADPGANLVSNPGLAFTASSPDSADAVSVETTDLSGNPVDFPFQLQTTCGSAGDWAVIDNGDSMARGNDVTAVTHVGTGQYEVTFGKVMTSCTFVAGIGDSGQNVTPAPGLAFVAAGHSSPNGVFVQTQNLAGALTDNSFDLQVIC